VTCHCMRLYALVQSRLYALSLLFAFLTGTLRRSSRRAEIFMVPLLIFLAISGCSSFLPVVECLRWWRIFPHRASSLARTSDSILLIFTGGSMKHRVQFLFFPEDYSARYAEAACDLSFSRWQRFAQLEPSYTPRSGLVCNSMMSVAGGWFFLMACEMFRLGNTRLSVFPGSVLFLQTAASSGNTAPYCGALHMIAVIVLLDQLVWAADHRVGGQFKFEAGVKRRRRGRAPVSA